MSQCRWSSYLCWSYVSTQVESHFQELVVLGNVSFRLTSTSLLSFVVVKVVINIQEGRVLTTNDMRKWEWELGQSQSFDRIHLSCYTLSPFSHVNKTRTWICCEYIEAKSEKQCPFWRCRIIKKQSSCHYFCPHDYNADVQLCRATQGLRSEHRQPRPCLLSSKWDS